MLKFENSWRYDPPGPISQTALGEFLKLISKTAKGEQEIIEHFKIFFASAAGSTSYESSNASWAVSDLENYMEQVSDNAPLFIEAMFDACESLAKKNSDIVVPDIDIINKILSKEETGYRIELPYLVKTASHDITITPEPLPTSLDDQAQEIIQTSINNAKKLLSEGSHRQAVQEVLWLMESVSTVFQGTTSETGDTIQGKYFNKIVQELRHNNRGTTLEQILDWITRLHGYLSAPSGGGIRHGMNLKEGVATSPNEAKLYCNLVISYVSFLLSEYERIKKINN